MGAASVREHGWRGFRYESRTVRAAAPYLAPVLLVGGAFQRKEDWGRIERGLLDHADVLAVDLPGWGSAGVLPAEYDADFLAGALCQVLDDAGLAQVNVLAGSYGTAIAYRLAQLRPARIARMTLVGTMSTMPDHLRAAVRHALDLLAAGRRQEFAEMAVAWLMSRTPDADIAAGAAVRRILLGRCASISDHEAAQFTANTRRLLRQEMIDPTVPPAPPALFTTGEHDTFTPPRLCRELAATCADSWYVEVARADHLMHLERGPELVDLASRFFGGAPVTGLPYARHTERMQAALVHH